MNLDKLFRWENTYRPDYEYARSAFYACAESFEPGDALVANEFSVADRLNQVSL